MDPARVSLPPLRGRVACEAGGEGGTTGQNQAPPRVKAAPLPETALPSPGPR